MQGFGLSLLLIIRHVVPAESKLVKGGHDSKGVVSDNVTLSSQSAPPPVHSAAHLKNEESHTLIVN
jgi:hypothetical protein